MKLIRYGNLIINPAQIVEAIYKSAGAERASHLELVYAVTESDERADYDGNHVSEKHEPYTRNFSGELADRLWRKLELLCEE